MPRLVIHGGTRTSKLSKLLRNEDGSILIITAGLMIILSILFAGMVEYGRAMIVREQTQTAADAAAIAAAGSGVNRYVKIEVISDRGMRARPCKENGECPPCKPCKTVKIPVIGDEKSLLDEGLWQDFCIDPCDCGGGDCWYEIKDRWVMYEIIAGKWGTDENTIKDVTETLTEAVAEALAWQAYPYQNRVSGVLSGLSLEEMARLLNNQNAFVNEWSSRFCNCYECYYTDETRYSDDDPCYYNCVVCKDDARRAFREIRSKKDWIEKNIATLNRIKNANNRQGPRNIGRTADDAANQFYFANYPEHSSGSGIIRLDVYGHDKRNSDYYPSVVVYAKSKLTTLFPEIFDKDFSTTVCAQGNTYYRDPRDQAGKNYSPLSGFGKWIKPPQDACWEEKE